MGGYAKVYFGFIFSYVKLYFLFYGTAYAVVHLFLARLWSGRKINPEPVRSQLAFLAVRDSILSHLLFGMIVAYAKVSGHLHGKMYFNLKDHGTAYFLGSIVILFFYNDLCFYLTHRFVMHRRLGYKYIHHIHHGYRDPTPFAGNAVSSAEPILNFALNYVPLILLPIHPYSLFYRDVLLTMVNVKNHLGYEIFPAGAPRHALLRFLTTPTHHSLHHSTCYDRNFAFFINYDLIFKTQFFDYPKIFESIKARSQEVFVRGRQCS